MHKFIFFKKYLMNLGIGINDSKYDNLRKGLVSLICVESGNIDSIIYYEI